MKSIKITTIKVSAKSGASLSSCLSGCIELAAKEWQNVELIHDQKTYNINIDDLVASIKSCDSSLSKIND